jgi:dienelactone hydrolase
MSTRLCLLWLFVLSTVLAAQLAKSPAPLPGDPPIDRYLKAETDRLSARFLDGAKTLAEWEKRKPRLRREYLEMLGLWPLPEKTPLKATVTGTLERDSIAIEKLHFQSRPGLYVTGNLYRPRKTAGKLPTILYVCGHSGRGRDGNKTAFQDHGMWFARNGYVCLVIDTLQLGEIAGKHHGTYNLGRWWWQAAGYTPAGVECFNGIRAIDYLVSRPDVDAGKIGVTGISGGGASTIWIAAADERVKCAVPVSGMSDLESYVSNKIINGHCDCMLMINTYGWEWTTIAALIAPRPMLFANSDNDRIFPMDGNRRIISRLRRVYKLYGKPDLVDDYVSKGGHDYRPDLRLAVFRWINKHIKGDTGAIKDATDKPLPGKQLRVFPEDSDIPKDALNAKIDETFVPRARVKLPEAKGFAAWKKGLLGELREKSFRTFPERIPPATPSAPRFAPSRGADTDYAGGTSLKTEPGVLAELHSLREKGKRGGGAGVLIVLGEDELSRELPGWARPYAKEDVVRVLVTRGGSPRLKWTKKAPPNYVERAHALIGRTVDQGRVWDIAATARFLAESEGKRKWTVVGRGQAGILAAYAALFEPGIGAVVVIDPPVSHTEGPIFLNVLRVLDIPDALGLLAPRPLTLVGARDRAFERTVEIFKRAGPPNRLKRK